MGATNLERFSPRGLEKRSLLQTCRDGFGEVLAARVREMCVIADCRDGFVMPSPRGLEKCVLLQTCRDGFVVSSPRFYISRCERDRFVMPTPRFYISRCGRDGFVMPTPRFYVSRWRRGKSGKPPSAEIKNSLSQGSFVGKILY